MAQQGPRHRPHALKLPRFENGAEHYGCSLRRANRPRSRTFINLFLNSPLGFSLIVGQIRRKRLPQGHRAMVRSGNSKHVHQLHGMFI